MSSGEKCSLLLMRDDGRTNRWRISLRLFRALCLTGALLFLLLGGSGWLIWTLYADNAALNTQLLQLDQENKTLSAARNRLSILEQLLDMPENAKLLALQSQQTRLKAAELDATPSDVIPKENTKDQNQEDAISLEAGPSSQFSSAPTVDMKIIGVENVHARSQGDKLRIVLDLYNPQQKNQLIGYVICTVKSPEGESAVLDISKDIASFRINRFKRAVFAPVLPAAMRSLAVLTVVIEINIDDRGTVYRNEYPVER